MCSMLAVQVRGCCRLADPVSPNRGQEAFLGSSDCSPSRGFVARAAVTPPSESPAVPTQAGQTRFAAFQQISCSFCSQLPIWQSSPACEFEPSAQSVISMKDFCIAGGGAEIHPLELPGLYAPRLVEHVPENNGILCSLQQPTRRQSVPRHVDKLLAIIATWLSGSSSRVCGCRKNWGQLQGGSEKSGESIMDGVNSSCTPVFFCNVWCHLVDL